MYYPAGREEGRSQNAPRRFKWHESAELQLKLLLDSEESPNGINTMLTGSIVSMDDAMNSLNKLLSDSVSKCMERVDRSCKGKIKWFDVNCSRLREEVKSVAKKLIRDSYNPCIRASFASMKKQYKLAVKRTKTAFRRDLVRQIDSASETDPKK